MLRHVAGGRVSQVLLGYDSFAMLSETRGGRVLAGLGKATQLILFWIRLMATFSEQWGSHEGENQL